MQHGHFTDALILLAAALVAVPLFHAARIGPVLGYLAAGLVIGPGGLGLLGEPERVEPFAELGVMFLLFTIGLDLSLERLRAMRRLVFGLGLAQVVVTSLAIGLVAVAFGATPAAALAIGGALAMSSTAAVVKVLGDRGEMTSRFGRAVLAVLLFQDLSVAPLLAVVPHLADGGTGLVQALGLALAKGAGAIVLMVLAGRLVLRPAFRLLVRQRHPELFTAASLIVALGAGWLSALAGLSAALGAFMGGLLLAGTPYRHQIEAEIQPFRGLLLGLFFMTVGMGLDPAAILSSWPQVAAIAAALLVGKVVLLVPLGLLAGLRAPVALRTALVLAQGGEFAFVLLGAATLAGVVAPDLVQPLTAAVILTIVATPWLAELGAWVDGVARRRLEGGAARPEPPAAPHVIVAGYGRVGITVCALLEEAGLPWLALDADMERVQAARQREKPVFFGDAGRLEVWRAAGVGHARLVVMTMDNGPAATRATAMLKTHYERLPIVVRVTDAGHARRALDAGATDAVAETFEASLFIGETALRRAGIDVDRADDLVEAYRADDYAGVLGALEAANGPLPDPSGRKIE